MTLQFDDHPNRKPTSALPLARVTNAPSTDALPVVQAVKANVHYRKFVKAESRLSRGIPDPRSAEVTADTIYETLRFVRFESDDVSLPSAQHRASILRGARLDLPAGHVMAPVSPDVVAKLGDAHERFKREIEAAREKARKPKKQHKLGAIRELVAALRDVGYLIADTLRAALNGRPASLAAPRFEVEAPTPGAKRTVFVRGPRNRPAGAEIALALGRAPSSVSHVDEETPEVSILELEKEDIESLQRSGAFTVYEDIQFVPFDPPGGPPNGQPPWANKSQKDVMEHIRAPEAWRIARGHRVTIAVVDTGVDGSMKEFAEYRRSEHNHAFNSPQPWVDESGHGTMCAAIACGSVADGGRYDGVAPRADLLSARCTFTAAEIYTIYGRLLRRKEMGGFAKGLVVSNSFGLEKPVEIPRNHPYLERFKVCAARGIVMVCAAGNNHAFGADEDLEIADHPNTIWSINSLDEVITVGTVDWDESNRKQGSQHARSSRGPGQWSQRGDKPDVVAPGYGEVAWGGRYRTVEWWGTSGACAQVAGLAALLLSVRPDLTPDQVRLMIRGTAKKLDAPRNCVGAGLIDCAAALQEATAKRSP